MASATSGLAIQLKDLVGTGKDSFEYLREHRDGRLNIIAVGKTGEGKSATLNTIIKYASDPRPKEFREEESPDSVAIAFDQCSINLFGLNCRLIDTMGLFDTETTPERKAERQFLKILANVISLCSDGIDAFLLVVDGTRRMSFETKETINVIQRSLGAAMLDHCIFALTRADEAKEGMMQKMEDSIRRYLKEIGYSVIEGQFIHFDNENRPKQQIVTLLKMIEVNLQKRNGCPYTHRAFVQAGQDSFEYLREHRDGRLNIIAVGKTGEGKSATLNTIIKYASDPRPKEFREEESPDSVTKAFDQCTINLFGLNCRLIDTMGLFDTKTTPERKAELQFLKIPDLEEEHKIVLVNLANVISLCSDGIDAFLLVVDGTRRMSFETKETINVIQRFLGMAMLDHCIFALTRADMAKEGTMQKMEDSIRRYLIEIGYTVIEGQFIHFDNENRPKHQIVTLLKTIEVNLQKRNGCPYTHIAFVQAQKVLDEEKMKLRVELETELQRNVKADIEKIRVVYDQRMQEVQKEMDEKTIRINNLREEAVEERNKFQNDINTLNNQIVDLDKRKEQEIQRAVQNATSKCTEDYLNKFRQMENTFQEQNKLLVQSSQAVDQLCKQVADLASRPATVVKSGHRGICSVM